MRRNTYSLNGAEFHSIKALSVYCGVNEKTITARLRRGMSVEDACEKIDGRCAYYMDEGERKSITQICKEQSKCRELVANRLKYGYTLNEALNKPKKVSRQGRPIVVNGILYNSIAEACRKLGLTRKEQIIRRRLKAGESSDTAFDFTII